MAQTKIKAGLFEGIIGNGTDGYFLMSNGDGTMTWSSVIINPTIASIAYPGSATAADPAGGETITVTGADFKTGATVTVGGTSAPAVSYVSSTQITFTTPAKTAGDYDIVVTNTDTGSATYINGISYNGIPSWTTAAGSLGTFASNTTISTITLQATEPDAGTITFNITNGALPTGLSLTGANIDGTTSLETADTLYTFTVTATDDENQATPRTFTITVEKAFVPSENFNIVTYSGNDSTRSITVGFQPDLIITKSRNTSYSNMVTDSVRGGSYNVRTNTDGIEESATTINFESNGYEIVWGGASNTDSWNGAGNNFVAWCWKGGGSAASNTDGSITSSVSANVDAGFSIVGFNNSSSGSGTYTLGHGLSTAPELIFVKTRDSVVRWATYNATSGAGYYLGLNETRAATAYSAAFPTIPSSSVFTLSNTWPMPQGDDCVAYCFHSVDGYQKINYYTGSGSSGLQVTTGFQPRFLLIKSLNSGTANWFIFDSVRGNGKGLLPNTSNTEFDNSTAYGITFGSNSFTLNFGSGTAQLNTSGHKYLYLAIA